MDINGKVVELAKKLAPRALRPYIPGPHDVDLVSNFTYYSEGFICTLTTALGVEPNEDMVEALIVWVVAHNLVRWAAWRWASANGWGLPPRITYSSVKGFSSEDKELEKALNELE